MIKNIKVLAVVKNGMIASYRYGLLLADDKGRLPDRIVEIPDDGLSERKYLKQLKLYGEGELQILKEQLEDAIKHEVEQGKYSCRFTDIGWNLMDGTPVFAFSNCCVTKDGIDYGSYTDTVGFDLFISGEYDPSLQYSRMRFLELFNILDQKPNILYPVFLVGVAALLNRILGRNGIAPALVMWIGGRPGSGKTELACTLGSFINKDPLDRTKARRKIFSAFGKPKNMNLSLIQHRGLVFILDDVKAEKVLGQREKTKICTDICIRSVKAQKQMDAFDAYQQEKMEETLDAGAIITGEYMDIYQSSMARMVYLDIDNMINDMEYSKTLKKLQDNPHILSDVMVYIIQYLCGRYMDREYLVGLEETKEELWNEDKKLFYGTNQSRLADSLSSLQLTARVVRDCAAACGANDSLDIEAFLKRADQISVFVMKRTALLINERDEILLDAYKEVVNRLKLKNPDKIYDDFGKLQIMPYILESKMDGVWISDINEFVEPESDIQCPAIICRVNSLIRALTPCMIKIAQWYNYRENWSVKIDNTRLRKAEIICAERRADGTFNNQFSYPVWDIWERTWEYEDCVCLNLNNRIIGTLFENLTGQDKNKQKMLLREVNDSVYDRIWNAQNDERQLKKALNTVKSYMKGR